MKVKLTEEQKESMSYADIAFLILNSDSKKIKIQDLFKKVIKLLGLTEEDYTNNIGDFFELLLIDKRFIMLENAYCDLKINHSTRIVFDEDEDEDIDLTGAVEEAEAEEPVTEEEINYDENTVDDDSEDELENLVILEENEDDNDMS